MKRNKNLLVVAAHPDDEVLGCGATMAKYSAQGKKIFVIYMTNGVSARNKYTLKEIENRKKAAIKSCKILGAKPIFFDFEDNKMDKYPLLDIVKKIEVIINKIKPEIVFTHYNNDLNIDHEITARATLTACRPLKKSFVKKLFMFDVPSSTEWTPKKKERFSPNYYEAVNRFVKKKIKALEAYKMELRKWPHPRSKKNVIMKLNTYGAESGNENSEAFILYRQINL